MAQSNPNEKKDLASFAILGVIAIAIFAYMGQKPLAFIIVKTSIPIFQLLGSIFNDRVLLDSVVYFKENFKNFGDLERVGYDDMATILTLSGEYFRWLLLPLVYIGFKLIIDDRIGGLKRFLKFHKLLREKALIYPSIRPVVGLNLLDDKFYTPKSSWRLGENPIDTCINNDLITYNGKPLQSKNIHLREEIPATYKTELAALDKSKLEVIFQKHLGFCLYESDKEAESIGVLDDEAKDYDALKKKAREDVIAILMKFKPHQRGIMAVMLMRSLGRAKWQKASYDLLEQMSTSFWIDKDKNKKRKGFEKISYILNLFRKNIFKHNFSSSNLNLSGADESISKLIHGLDDVKFEILCINMRKTAWSNVLLVHFLDIARQYGGVLITADFIWLKPMDRTLFYVLNSLGRKTPLVEGAGAYAQMHTESVIGHASVIPDVSEAVLAFEDSLRKNGWIS